MLWKEGRGAGNWKWNRRGKFIVLADCARINDGYKINCYSELVWFHVMGVILFNAEEDTASWKGYCVCCYESHLI